MRISADKNDSGYTKGCMRLYGVYLDGVLQTNVVTADEEEGIVIRTPEDADGLIVVDGFFAEDTLHGRVMLVKRY